MRVASFILLAMSVLAGCAPAPTYEHKVLGTATISAHKTPIGGLMRQLCQFRVEIAGLTLGYAGSSTTPIQHNKCLTMKNGDTLTVTLRTRTGGDDKQPALRYTGKAGEVEFPLN